MFDINSPSIFLFLIIFSERNTIQQINQTTSSYIKQYRILCYISNESPVVHMLFLLIRIYSLSNSKELLV